jgi:hypothetical protein
MLDPPRGAGGLNGENRLNLEGEAILLVCLLVCLDPHTSYVNFEYRSSFTTAMRKYNSGSLIQLLCTCGGSVLHKAVFRSLFG